MAMKGILLYNMRLRRYKKRLYQLCDTILFPIPERLHTLNSVTQNNNNIMTYLILRFRHTVN